MSVVTVKIQNLMLDGKNPRHPPTSGQQREVVRALLDEVGDKMAKLAEDMVAHGPNPLDNVMVMSDRDGRTYTVLEGNRRVAVRKLLKNPALAGDHPLAGKFRELAARADNVPDDVEAFIVPDREAGRHWQEIRHRGELGGAGIVSWGSAQQERFSKRRGSQADRALVVIDAIRAGFPADDDLLDLADEVQKSKLTTFGRLVSDPTVRDRLGIELHGDTVSTHYSRDDLRATMARVLSDLANGMPVTKVKSKQDRVNYIDSVITRERASEVVWQSDAEPLKPGKAPTKAKKRVQTRRTQRQKKKLLDGLDLVNLGDRVSDVLHELQKLDIDTYPNTAGILLRVITELAVTEVHENELGAVGNKELKTLIKRVLHQIDPSDKEAKYAGVRAGLSDGTSVMAVSTMHAFVHNPHYSPTGTEIRTIAANYQPFLEALDGMA